jgi:hypothetical protein
MFENEVTKGNIRGIKRFALIEIWIAIYIKSLSVPHTTEVMGEMAKS